MIWGDFNTFRPFYNRTLFLAGASRSKTGQAGASRDKQGQAGAGLLNIRRYVFIRVCGKQVRPGMSSEACADWSVLDPINILLLLLLG